MRFALHHKLIAMTKFSIVLLWLQIISATVLFGGTSRAQTLDDIYLNADWERANLAEVFQRIQTQTDYFFSYDREEIRKVCLEASGSSINLLNFLRLTSARTGLHFTVQDELILVDYPGQADRTLQAVPRTLIVLPQAGAELPESELTGAAIIYQNNQSSRIVRSVSGFVTDESGEPLVGATILVKGTSTGTVTDIDGRFSLAIPDDITDPILQVNYIGYETIEIPATEADMSIVLSPNSTQLDEVVVIGYGTGTKEKFNGAVSKVENDEINNYSAATLDQAIAGTIAGVQILGNNKNPGENSVIQIRGLNTLTAGTNPLIVVDGNPLTEGSALSAINTQDIESISVLKDAASAAIYGSRASNGVILITTKQGENGPLRVTFDTYLGVQDRIDNFQLADAYETAQFDYDARNFGYLTGGEGRSISDNNATRDANGGGKRSRIQPFLQDYLNGTSGLTNTNWADEVFRSSLQQNYYLNLSGGSARTNYAISFGYFDQENIIVDSDYQRYTTNLKLNGDISDAIRFGISTNIAVSDANPVGYRSWSDFNINNNGQPDPAFAIILNHPYYSPYNPDGTLAPANQIEDNNANWDGPISGNVLATIQQTDYTENTFRAFGNTFLEFEPFEGLVFKTSFGGDYNTGTEAFFAPSTLGNYRTPVTNSRTMAFRSDFKRENIITENILTYGNTFGKHTIDALVGYSYQQELRSVTRLESQDFTDNNLRNIAGATNPTATNNSSKWALNSVFTRLQYDFASRYSISASFRRDGSSRFGANTKYGNFASFSAGWTISNESFFPQEGLLSFAKARVSWGQTGNNQIGDFAAIALVGQDNYVIDEQLEAGAFTATSPNADLSWETNTSLNFGLDLGFLDNRLFLTAEYYDASTTDLLLSVPVPQQSGFSSSLQNIGELDNTGLELELRGVGFKLGQMTLGFNANFSTNQNEVVALGNGQNQIISSNGGMGFITRVGDPIAQFYAYDIIGVYRSETEIANETVTPLPGTEVGDYIVRDVDGDGEITPDDRTLLGDYNPDFTFGFGINLEFKGFDVSAQFTGVSGRKAGDRMVYYAESGEGFFVPNQYYVDNYFTDDNPDGFFRRPDFSSFSSAGRLTRSSSLSVLDADYFRLRSLQIGYTFPDRLTESIGMSNLRLYVTGNNIFNITDFRGYNPDGIDTRSNTTQTLTRGWIPTTNPLTRFLAFGLNAKF